MARELTRLGERPRVEDGGGGVSWTGDARSMMRANLWLRTASRVVVRVAEFRATAFHELETRAKRIDWSRFLGAGATPEFRVTARKSKLYHSDAIAERLFSAVRSQRSESRQLSTQNQLFVVRAFKDVFTVSADTSGALLHMRGYKQAVGKAPLRETLAAAMLLASDWTGEEPLLDPFCGSGTIPIEGALIARRLAPGRRREFAFMQWPSFDAGAWRALVADADTGALARSPVAIVASDRDAGVVAAARANAERAGVAADVDLSVRAVSAIEPPGETGLIATNPPYGKRVGQGGDVRNLYAQLGKVLRAKCPGWRLTLLSPEERLTRQLGLEVDALLSTSHGGIKVAVVTGSARFLHR